jgi:hypothetical protein
MAVRGHFVVALVAIAACEPCRSTEGESCDDDSDCRGKLACRDKRCVIGSAMFDDMARQSGVPVTSEKPVASSGPGAVRVRSAAGKDVVFAVCAPNERVIGGWCDPPGHGGGAAGYTNEDTIGGQWKCVFDRKKVRAFALCQLVAP